ncbi:MAG: prepilin-type N-terminal cleavage/methylation domain-containing protein [Planctomycetota bacterium]
MRSTQESGFTLIEVVVVLAIITLLVGIAAPSLSGLMSSYRGTATDQELDALVEAARAFCEDTAVRPPDIDSLHASKLAGFGGPYISDSLGGRDVEGEGFRHDAWGRRYRYATPGATTIVLTSAGRDGRFDTDDDVARTLDLRPILRRLSIERLEILNLAVNAYNKVNLTTDPLPTSVDSAVSKLVSGGFLPRSGDYTRDAFGDRFVVGGSPVVRFLSPNFGTEGDAPASGGSGRIGSSNPAPGMSRGSAGRGDAKGRSGN